MGSKEGTGDHCGTGSPAWTEGNSIDLPTDVPAEWSDHGLRGGLGKRQRRPGVGTALARVKGGMGACGLVIGVSVRDFVREGGVDGVDGVLGSLDDLGGGLVEDE